jgi:uncharacterized cupredoxin-like copper-binding protein
VRPAGGRRRIGPRRTLATAALVFGVTAATTATGYLVESSQAEATAPLGPGLVRVEVDMSYSRFSLPEDLAVHEGTLVEFVVTNTDPINHELIVGDDAVHARHATGHEPFHPPVPGEVSVGPGERGLTTYLFDEPGEVRYVCHLAGHAAYGMEGTITVVPVD